MDTFLAQLITMISLLVGNILFGTLPLFIVKIFGQFGYAESGVSRRNKCSSFLMYFGGGVLLSNTLIVLLPQARKFLERGDVHSSDENEELPGYHHDGFPIAEFIVSCGFFGAYLLQELTIFLISKLNSSVRKSSDARVRYCSCAKRHTECSRTYKGAIPEHSLFEHTLDSKLESGNVSNSAAVIESRPPDVTLHAQSDLLRSSIISQTVPNYGTLANISEPPTDSPLPVLSPPVLLEEQRHLEHQTAAQGQTQLLTGSIIAVVALILQYYLFLGANLGFRTTTTITWYYALLACMQNFLLTFSSSSDLVAHNVDIPCVALNISLLSIMSPIGAIVAMVKPEFFEKIPLVANGVVASIACGVLIYTTFYMTLRQRKSENVHGLTKFSSILLGSGIMGSIQYALLEL